jgi:aminoglycoside phosphotransferase (APT) family kinase protein
MSTGEPYEVGDVRRSSRDLVAVRVTLEHWLAGRMPDATDVAIPELETTSATGMSSETLLFTAAWTAGPEHRSSRLVGRLAPDAADVPVFPSYDMTKQFRAIGLVGDRSPVPVPRVLWDEPDADVIGTPFFVMERVDGVVPPDIMPYPMGGNWLFDASPEAQRSLQDATVDVLAQLHAIADPTEALAFVEFPEPGPSHLRRHVAHARAWYEYAARRGHRSPLVERGFAWLDDHWPSHEGPTVLAWGDSRIGNVLYRDFRPVAVLDWEMVGLGPREIDLGWLVYAHRCFQTMATTYGLPGMPEFLRPDDVASRYEAMSGYAPRDFDWYLTYAAVQWGVVGLITGLRAVHFGEREMPDDVDDLLYNRASLEPMVG